MRVLSDSPGLEDFCVGLVDSLHHLPRAQLEIIGKCFEEIQITEVL